MKKKTNPSLKEQYQALDGRLRLPVDEPSAIRADLLIAFPYEHPATAEEISIDTEEFSAVCPWTGLPDQGKLLIRYVPDQHCLELKSLKYYLLTYRSVGIVQEHAAARILEDLIRVTAPREMTVTLDYCVRGGLHTVVKVHHP